MGFFGEVIDAKNTFETDVPDGYTLTIRQACLDPSSADSKGNVPVLKVQTANEDRPIILCIFNASKGFYQSSLAHEFGPEDSPISFTVEGDGEIHLSGVWGWDEASPDGEGGCGHEHGDTDSENECGVHGDDSEEVSEDDEDEEDDDEEEEEEEEEEETAPELVYVPAAVTASSKGGKKRPRASSTDSSASATTAKPSAVNKSSTSAVAVEVVPVVAEGDKKKAKKQKKSAEKTAAAVEEKQQEASVSMDPAASAKGTMRKKWRVKPQNDEGILILEPKTLKQTSGVTITDFVMGKGAEPKLGSKLKITYEGMFPDGKVFDAALKRTKPFTFRKGTGQVIKGLDFGIEGMKIGGSREIIVPSELGYGKGGMGEIPGNQTLVFRVTLVGVNK